MKIETVEYKCDLCGKTITELPLFGGLLGNAYILEGVIGMSRRIDLCDECREFIRKKGHEPRKERVTK